MADAWAAYLKDGAEPARKKGPGVRSNQTDEASKLKELIGVLTKLALKTAQDSEYVRHADRTRGKSGHDEGGPDGPALVAVLHTIMKSCQLSPEEKEAITNFLTQFPPPTVATGAAAPAALQRAVPCCKVQKMHSSSHFKLFVRLPYHQSLEDILEKHLTTRGSKQFFGQAPRGALEKKAQELLKELNLDDSDN
eukprot:524234-Heterocapsa_arctica.AAC.1